MTAMSRPIQALRRVVAEVTAGRPSSPADAIRQLRERDRSERATLARARHRQSVIFALLALCLFALTGRAAYWQIGQQSALAARADTEHLRAIELPAGRGEILDSQGRILALSITERSVIADPDVIRQVNALASISATLAQLLGQPLGLIRAQLNLPRAYVQLHDASGTILLLSAAQEQAVSGAIGAGNLPGVALYPVVRRIYPSAALAAQVLGFVRTSDGLGQYGIEQAYQQQLAGRPGEIYTAVDAAGDPIASAPQRQIPAVPGANVTLTLDANVQYWVEQGLAQAVQQTGATGGSVIVLDPHTGAVIAMAGLPSFDPGSYGAYPLADFDNPAISAAYDPGSVMKAITMSAGIDTGAITPTSTFYDTGEVTVDGTRLYNWDRIGHGEESMTQVLQYSANVGAVWVAQHMGAQPFDAYLSAFGFGAPTGIGLPSESAGQLANPQSPGDVQLELAENAFGEGITVTPLQLAAAYGALANGGLLMRPYIVQSIAADGGQGQVTTSGPQPVRQVVSPATASAVTTMLVNSAYVSEAQMNLVRGYSVAAKTGTSTPNATDPSLTYATVVGYAPASHPRFVLLVKLDHPQTTIFGGSAAGPLWRALAEQLFIYYRIPPDMSNQT